MLKQIALVVFVGACSKAAEPTRPGASKVDLAKHAAQRFAFEAYPQWAAAHPEKECPGALAELLEYVSDKDLKDPWGGTYRMLCGKDLPNGVHGLATTSPGEDGKDGTADDIKSWE